MPRLSVTPERINALYAQSGLPGLHRETMTFAATRETPDNAEAIATARGWAGPRGLVFAGPTSTGKTHLACCVANALIVEGTGVKYRNVPDMMDRWLYYKREGYIEDVIDELGRICHVELTPLLIMDDAGVERPADWERMEIQGWLYLIAERRIAQSIPTIWTMNLRPDGDRCMHLLGDRVQSRILRTCDVVLIEGPKYELAVLR